MCVCETAGMPQFIIYPELIGVWESERNASSPKSQSMTLIFQLDPDLYRNPSKRQDLWVRTVTFIDPVFGKLIFVGYKRMKIEYRLAILQAEFFSFLFNITPFQDCILVFILFVWS